MKLVWSVPGTESFGDPASTALTGCYQDMLRSVGAWLDARGYRLAHLSTSGTNVVVEAEVGEIGDDVAREVFRLDFEALVRLMQAARADRDRFQQAR